MLLDIRHRVEIPGGIDIEAQLAGPAPRFLAFAIDFSIRAMVLAGLVIVALVSSAFIGATGFGFWLLAWFLLEWFYPVLFEVFWNGQTPGKKALGITVVHDDLTPLTFGTSLVRNLLRAADFLPLLYLFGLIAMVSSQRFQRLGDLAAGTFVVSLHKIHRGETGKSIEPIAPLQPLSRDDQTAIIDFLHRSSTLSSQRQSELANILEDLTHCKNGQGVEYLQRLGTWYTGAR